MMPQPAARRTARSGSCRRRQSRESARQTSAMASSRERWVGPKRRTADSALLEPALAAGMGSHKQHGEAGNQAYRRAQAEVFRMERAHLEGDGDVERSEEH